MKNFIKERRLTGYFFPKIDLKMKLTTLLLIVSLFKIEANTYSQNTKLTLDMYQVDVEAVFDRIESISEFRFLFESDKIDLKRKVSIDVKKQKISEILKYLFKWSDIEYQIRDRQILLSKAKKEPTKDKPIIYEDKIKQTTTVTGTITDVNSGIPLAGVNIIVKGTSNGVSSDFDGNYSINVKDQSATLVFSFVGYTTKEIAINGQSTINVTMHESTETLDQVVVTAFGIKRDKKSLGYAVSRIESKDITVAGVSTNPVSSLYGKASGVGITTNAAGPTGAVDIKIRGAAGLESSANTRPLFVVDGMPIYDSGSSMAARGYDPLNSFDYGSGINDINPEDIASIEILKGAKATVLYGGEGANGVVLITTKKGSGTRGLGVNINTQYTYEIPRTFIDFQNEYGTGTSQYTTQFETLPGGGQGPRQNVWSRFNWGPKFDGSPVQFLDGSIRPYQAYPNNYIDLFRNGSNAIHTVAISGGNEIGNMRVSYTNQEYQGLLPNNYQKKHVFNVSGTLNASDFASVEINTNLYKIKTHNRQPNLQNIVAWGINRDYDFNAIKDLYKNDDGSRFNAEDTGWPGQFAPTYLMDALWEQYENSDLDDKFHLITSLKTTLNFTDKLSFIGQIGLDYTDTDFTTKNPITRFEPENAGGRYSYGRDNISVENYRGILNYDFSLFDDQLKIFSFVGGEYRKATFKSINVATFGDLRFPDFWSLNNEQDWPDGSSRGRVRGHTYGSQVTYSAFGSTTLSWKNDLYLELQARNDWSSTLPPTDNSFFYPGVGLSWNFTNTFDIPFIEYGKLRASWADVGRGAPGGLTSYFANRSFGVGGVNNTDALTVNSPSSLFAGNLKPERKREFEIGFDARFLKGSRLETSFSFYHNNIYDQIMGVDLSPTTGAGDIKINAGNVANWGYELLLKGTPLLTDKFRWDLTFTAAKQQSEVKKLYPGITQKITGSVGNSIVQIAEEGKPFGELHMFDYLTDGQGNRVVDNNGYYVLDQSELKAVANTTPDIFGGFLSDFYFKGFNFHIGLDYKYGSTIFSRSNYYYLGMGITKETLQYRDEAHGGLAYYIDPSGERIPWQHSQPAPADATDGRVYHDGVINPGVVNVGTADNPVYQENDRILSAYERSLIYINDLGQNYAPDGLHKNDYIKLRELSLSYTLPKDLVNKVGMQKMTVSFLARNLFYLYKTIPNIDPESTLGTDSWVEDSAYPTATSLGMGLNISF
ncbi:SusC/RagA family TonB-linked outer membrane protein [Flavivirga spongiicola]|uniref:SusC/RagA family TonB-linked outer membrane protein n=1 Tax=Flavivirga spongiicola TaxID=421621 RepID=A0ABU7XVQ4_9FLAO|nr:SusC/RagA family TonB-linked outer membrane protein [Flavivirga sp. MEBiC05379]MDO5979593.1 SusC/RagA family TonB-linked outer membrane protein [Flavivirga sp. MEBiC05379]